MLKNSEIAVADLPAILNEKTVTKFRAVKKINEQIIDAIEVSEKNGNTKLGR